LIKKRNNGSRCTYKYINHSTPMISFGRT
jgi:hypothetical protein